MNVYETHDLTALLAANSYPGRGIVLGNTADGKQSVAAYFIMGRSENSRNRIFVLLSTMILSISSQNNSSSKFSKYSGPS